MGLGMMICFRLKVETIIIPFRLIPIFLCFNLVQSPIDLGRNENDVEILQTLIIEAIQNYEAIPSQSDQYGQRYIVDFPITRNQNTANVRTTWIVRPDEDFPRLVSCYILR
jgi:hypothetical protein